MRPTVKVFPVEYGEGKGGNSVQFSNTGSIALPTNPSVFVVHVVSAVAAMIMLGSLARLVLVLRKNNEVPRGLLWLAVGLLTSTVARLFKLVLNWLAVPAQGWVDFYPTFISVLAVVCMPVILYTYYGPIDPQTNRAHLPFHLRLIALANAALTLIVLSWSYLHRGAAGLLLSIAIGCAITAGLLVINASNFRYLRVRHRGIILFFLLSTSGLITISSVLFYTYLHRLQPKNSMLFSISVSLAHMMIILGTMFVFANLRLADVMLKKVMRIFLMTVGVVSVWGCINVLASAASAYQSMRIEAIFQCLSIVTITLIARLAKPVVQYVDHWLDSWVFEQPDFLVTNQALWERLLGASQETEIYRIAEQTLQSVLSLSNARIISRSQLGGMHPKLSLVGAGPYVLRHDDPMREILPPSADMLVPIFRGGAAQQIMVIGRGELRPALTNTELSFIERVAVQVSTRLEILSAEKGRISQRERESVLRQELAEAELRALRAQINPHFLFNSLNTIADLTVTAPECAEQMTLRLAQVFRYVLAHTDSPYTTVREEIEFVRSYLAIEKMRFENRLMVEYDISPQVLEDTVPALLLQPLIENALKHGLGMIRKGGTLRVSARYIKTNVLELAIVDNGAGLQKETILATQNGNHVGLANVKKRLTTAYNEKALLQLIPREDGGVEAKITIEKGHDTSQ